MVDETTRDTREARGEIKPTAGGDPMPMEVDQLWSATTEDGNIPSENCSAERLADTLNQVGETLIATTFGKGTGKGGQWNQDAHRGNQERQGTQWQWPHQQDSGTDVGKNNGEKQACGKGRRMGQGKW